MGSKNPRHLVRVPTMTNKEVAEKILRGKVRSTKVRTMKLATAIRVAGHRAGGVITVQRVKRGFKLVRSAAKISHRKKAKPSLNRYARPNISNREIVETILTGKRLSTTVRTMKLATAIRVAGHRAGGVITVQRVKGGFRLVKSGAKVSHRKKPEAPKGRKKPRR